LEPTFFTSAEDFRAWLIANGESETSVQVGLYKRSSATRGISYEEARDEGLCFGWIDGVMHSIDTDRFTIRFTPRKPRSIWSRVNIARVEALLSEGRMTPAGIAAFEARTPDRVGVYSSEQDSVELPPEFTARLMANSDAAAYWNARPPGYRKQAAWWVISAKREETRARRLEQLIACCAAGEPIPLLRPTKR